MKQTLVDSVHGLLRAYSSIIFLEKPQAGLIVLAATMYVPNLGLSGLIAAIAGISVARLLNFPYIRIIGKNLREMGMAAEHDLYAV